MEVYHALNEFTPNGDAVVTVGTFDGVHLGHRRILNRIVQRARAIGGRSVLLTFDPHPRKVLFPEVPISILTTQKEKIKLLSECGLDALVILPFTKSFSRMTSAAYVRDILINGLGTKELIIGYDHQFGRNREGSIEDLKECASTYHFNVEEIQAKEIDEVKISSTKIRQALAAGHLEVVNKFLGYPYTIIGEVIKGKQIGRTIGYPTANISLSSTEKLLPPNGVYAAQAFSESMNCNAVVNIGVRPTFSAADEAIIEVHCLDFSGDLYNRPLEVRLISRLRSELKFSSTQLLSAQIAKDIQHALRILPA